VTISLYQESSSRFESKPHQRPQNGSRTGTLVLKKILECDRPRGCASEAARVADLFAEEEPTRDITRAKYVTRVRETVSTRL
jgi:hypothetical protein